MNETRITEVMNRAIQGNHYTNREFQTMKGTVYLAICFYDFDDNQLQN